MTLRSPPLSWAKNCSTEKGDGYFFKLRKETLYFVDIFFVGV
jgi:hypothetical protein